MIILLFILSISLVLFLLIASRRMLSSPHRKKIQAPAKSPLHNEEFSTELAVPLPQITQPEPPAADLPHSYGIDRLILLARDPSWLYAYWEISAACQEDFGRHFGPRAWENTRPALRVYDVTGIEFNGQNALSVMDVGLNEQADNWHICVNSPNHSYMVDLGRIFPDGRFFTMLRSNTVQTPRNSLSDRTDEQWAWIEGIYRFSRIQLGQGSAFILEEMAARAGELPLNISSPIYKEEAH